MGRPAALIRPLRAPRPADAAAVIAAALYVVMVLRLIVGVYTIYELVLAPLPLLLPVALFFRRTPLSRAQALSAGATGIAAGACGGGLLALTGSPVILALPVLLLLTAVAGRRPALTLAAMLFCSGAFGSLQALAHVPAAKLADALLLALWIATAWAWWKGGHEHRRFTPGLVAITAYVVISAVEIVAADNGTAATQSFRSGAWHMAAMLLVAFAPWSAASRARALRLAVVVATAVGAYATYRWAVGPAPAERTLALQSINNVLDGDLRPVGSFATAKELAFWTSIMVPFLVGLALVWRDRWRLIALTGAGACTIGMLAPDVRAGPAGAVPGVLAVVALHQLSQAFRGRRGPTVVVAIVLGGIGAAGAFTLTLGDKPHTTDRYRNILEPTQDPSYQARLVKWRTALDDIETAPLGHGLGTAGGSQKRYGVFTNISNVEIDNSYLKVAYEQGFVLMVVLAAALLFVLVTLMRGGVLSTDPTRAGPAIAASGTLITMLIVFYVGDYIEGLPALGGWIVAGLGLAELTRDRAGDA